MTSRELVCRTLEFDSPARIPRQMWLLPWAVQQYPEPSRRLQRDFPDDIGSSPSFLKQFPHISGEKHTPGTYIDEWGCVFQNLQAGVIGEVKEPLLHDWSRIEDLRVPTEALSVDTNKVNEFCASSELFLLAGTCPRPFERAQFLRGTVNLFMDFMDRPTELDRLLAILHGLYVKEMELWAKTDVDALYFMDDWGSQKALLVSPDLWRELFKPLYREYAEIAHRNGKYIFMHTDGYVLDIFPDLIELEIDAVNSQIFCMGVEEIGKKFAGEITFWGEMDRQQILPNGSLDEVIAASRLMKSSLHRGGGLIAQCEFGAGANPENVRAFFEFWEREAT
ncbi:MAG: methyltransferase [Candidatus Eisenbacteria bacterium]|uniref:Methyltransferase n=1 Tax=Eiseniibacteriota bacterium TaxID=2212470 RepID=A0A948RYP5_UNCEI|nr:methyltransferase [Candidatus Eisenbacteria bacterium]MBU1947718.1 methyltransferase [Candidatus Eisenbacteria bacterium]MBU2692038.1 methyltransferase [Candidatus Eisenbacteria bacterium]